MIKASVEYKKIKNREYVYNIMPLENIDSVMKNGILCYNLAQKLPHQSVAMSDVQARRNRVMVTPEKSLHDYANLYFTYSNPMMYLRSPDAETLCVLAVSNEVLDIDGCVLTDMNAASDLVRFYNPLDGLKNIDFNKVFQRYWVVKDDPYASYTCKRIKCAEVLIPFKVPSKYIKKVCVLNNDNKNFLISKGLNLDIIVNSSVFFR